MQTLISPSLQALELTSLSTEVLSFFNHVLWGTQEVLYRIPDWTTLFKDLPSPRYLILQKNGRPIAARMLLKKTVFSSGEAIPAFYHSLFSVHEKERGKGYGKQLAELTLRRLRSALVHGGLIYAYIEAANTRSESIALSLGYQKFGEFKAMTFSRLFPKPSARVQALTAEEQETLIHDLQTLYAGHALTDFRLSLKASQYWVLKENGKIIAGVQANPQSWQIESLGGLGGQVAMRVIPSVPLLRDLFNPQLFKFLKLGNLYAREGYEKRLADFLGAVLSLHNHKTAMLYVDKKSPVYQRIAKVTSFGVLNAVSQTSVNVFGYFHRMKASSVENLRRPLAISSLDI